MPRNIATLTGKEEEFALAIAAGCSRIEAAKKAGYKADSEKMFSTVASAVASRPRVQKRIKELRDQYAKAQIEAVRGAPPEAKSRSYGVQDAMAEIDRMMALAEDKENPGAMGKAIELRMRLYGLGVSDAKNPKDADVPPEELEAALAQLKAMREAIGGGSRAH